ncbi:unnamed protein product [Discosporangium mesarthrocarpum]
MTVYSYIYIYMFFFSLFWPVSCCRACWKHCHRARAGATRARDMRTQFFTCALASVRVRASVGVSVGFGFWRRTGWECEGHTSPTSALLLALTLGFPSVLRGVWGGHDGVAAILLPMFAVSQRGWGCYLHGMCHFRRWTGLGWTALGCAGLCTAGGEVNSMGLNT